MKKSRKSKQPDSAAPGPESDVHESTDAGSNPAQEAPEEHIQIARDDRAEGLPTTGPDEVLAQGESAPQDEFPSGVEMAEPDGGEPEIADATASDDQAREEAAGEEAPNDDTPGLDAIPDGLVVRPLVDVIEAILFASQKPVSAKELRAIFKGAAETADPAALLYAKVKEPQFREVLSELAYSLQERGSTYELRETAAGWQLMTRPDFSPWLRQLFPENRPARLSAPALETLAIIAYRQPITRADIEAVRGVAVDGVMQTLLDRGLIRIGGRAEIPGRPLLYETTQFFMEHFGLRDLDELPNSAELRKVALPTAEVAPAETPAPDASAREPASEATPSGEPTHQDTPTDDKTPEAGSPSNNDTVIVETQPGTTNIDD